MSATSPKKNLLVTGGSQGIGRATVEHFLAAGWRVAFVARNKEVIDQAVDELIAKGYPAEDIHGEVFDVGNLDDLPHLTQLPFLGGRLDALVLNAFYQNNQPAHLLPREDWEMSWKINNLSPILLIQACFPMLQASQGSIVYVGSIMDQRLGTTYAAYGASKAYMSAFVKQAAMDFGPLGVRINTVSPGATMTEALERAITQDGRDAKELCSEIPMGQRFGLPAEIAEGIYFAITGPRYFHGRDVRIDGGMY